MKQNNLPKTNEEMAEDIVNLKGKALENYIAEVHAVLGIIKQRLKEGNHTKNTGRAYKKTKRALEEILEVVEVNRSN